MPLAGFMLKEITVKGSLSYTHEDFQQVVEAFKEGTKYVDAMVSH
jgi:threonine dehydrogenase-like Zn-dependent dehydrogenase